MKYNKEDLRPSIILSTCIHVGMMCALYFGLPSFFEPPPPMSWKPVPVDIVDIGAITNTRVRKQKEQAAKTAPKKKKKPAKVKEVKKPEPKPSVKEAPKPKPKADEVVLPTKKKIKKKKKPKKKKKTRTAPQEDPLASVLKNVAKMKKAEPTPPDVKEDPKKRDGDKTESKINQQGPALSDRLTISQEDALRRQISSCWNMPIGARHAENLIVEVLIEVNQDRTVRKAEVVDQLRMSTDSYFRAAAEAALRALRHPRCSPLELPPEQYEQWKTIRFNFDPRDML